MKKLVAIICVVTMIFSLSVTAFASDWDVLLQQRYTSYDATTTFSFELNKPLEFLSCLNEEAGFDVKYMIEELFKAKYTAKVQAEMREDALAAKIAMAINADVPIKLSEDLKFGADVTFYVWMEYDFTNAEDAKYSIIVKNPLNGEYLVMDYFKLMGQIGNADIKSELTEALNKINLEEGIKEIAGISQAAYKKNAALKKVGRNYTVTFTNDGLVDMIFDIVNGYLKSDYVKSAGVDYSSIGMGDIDMATVQALVKGLGIFGENDAYVMKFETNYSGKITQIEDAMHIDFNVCELAAALGASEYDVYPLTKENSDVDITIKSKTVYEKINAKNVVDMPVITDENSIDLYEMLYETYIFAEPEYDYEFDGEYEQYQPEEFYNYAYGVFERGMYVSVEDFLESAGYDGDNIKIEQSTVIKGDRELIRLVISSDYMEPVVVEGSAEGFSYFYNGEEVRGGAAFAYIQEYDWETYESTPILCVNVNVLQEALDCRVESVTIYYIDYFTGNTLTTPECQFWFYRKNPMYVPAEKAEAANDAVSVGIIGGADGPTEVFVTITE